MNVERAFASTLPFGASGSRREAGRGRTAVPSWRDSLRGCEEHGRDPAFLLRLRQTAFKPDQRAGVAVQKRT